MQDIIDLNNENNNNIDSNNNNKKPKFDYKKYIPLAIRATFLLTIVLLVVYIITVLADSNGFMNDFSERSALVLYDDDYKLITNKVDVHYDNLYEVVDKVKYAKDKDEVIKILNSYKGSPLFGDLRYYSQGVAYDCDGLEIVFETSGEGLIEELAKSNIEGCTEIYYDKPLQIDCIAFFTPVRGSSYIDGLISICPARNLINIDEVIQEKTSAIILMDSTGKVYAQESKEDINEFIGNNFYTFINKLTNKQEMVNIVSQSVSKNKKSACTIDTPRGDYVITSSPLETINGNLILVTINATDGLIAPEMIYIRHVLNISVIAIVSLIIGIAYAAIYYKKTQHALENAITLDPIVGCANTEQFRYEANRLIQKDLTNYAVVIIDIRQFPYLSNKLKEFELTELLKYVAKIIETFCGNKETFGYFGDGRYGILLYTDDEKKIREKLRLIETVCNKHPILGSSKAKRKFNIGVCLSYEFKKYSVQELINNAIVACEKAKNNINVLYVMYDKKLNLERDTSDRIESEMENALVNNEFRLFLQPKINLVQDKIDSAEALVRWFDTKTGEFRFPGEFIGLFESNGFITKLDHFMYIESLKYISQAVEKGEKVVPISVNVSMVTVNDPGFLDFYIDNKKRYRVGDGYIVIEFTESFAVEDYDKMNKIVKALHDNGIKCSLDDFGTGYSTLGVLKNIPFDEIKFDRIFLQEGINKDNDDIMLKSLVTLAKTMGIRTVQEGVENKEMFDKVVAFGFDVVQGFYYAKAIPLEEYKLFINSNTSIKYKSLVK